MWKKGKRLFSLCLGLVLSLGVGASLSGTHGETTGVRAASSSVEVKYNDFSGGTTSSGSEMASTIAPFTITFDKGYRDTSKTYTQSYATGTILFNGDSTVSKISSIVITASSGSYNGAQSNGSWSVKSGGGSVSVNSTTITYTGASTTTNSVKLSHSKQLRWTKIVVSYETASTTPLDSIELKNYPTSSLEIGNHVTLSYYGMDTEAEDWTGDVVYVSSNEDVATIDDDGVLTAVGGGTSDISVYANAGEGGAKVESDPVTITVLADPERSDLPTGIYVVNIDYSGVKKNDTVPASQTYEIKEKEGTGADRVWYKNMSIAYSNVTTKYDTEYTFASSTSTATITNSSNAKITSVVINYYDTKRLTLTDDSSTAITGTAASNVVTYNLNSTTFTLKATTTNTSLYSMQITFSVADENEQFLSLVVNKSASWNKTSYKEKQSPSNDGLVATANYTTDGTTISRSVDVTSQVSSWAFTPSILSTSDTSFTAVASWNGYTSNSFTVEGITVAAISGALESGRYFISETGTLEVREYKNKTSTAVDIAKASAWDFELVADDTYTISATIDSVKYYLYISNDNSGLRTSTTSAANWTLTALTGDDVGKYSLVSSDGTNDRYLCNYLPTSTNDWRTYKSSSIGTMYKLSIVEEKEVFATNFLNTFTEGCNPNGGYDSNKMDWAGAKTQFNTLSADNKSVFVNTETDDSSTDNVVKCVTRYVYIVNKYGTSVFEDFMNRGNFPTNSSNAVYKLNDCNTPILVVVLVAFTSVTAIGSYFFLRKRRYN